MTREEKLWQYGEGPWLDEPDRVEWRSEGLPCLIVRNNLGALCGYVGVPEGHPWYGRHYDDVDADVHGGLTFSDPCSGHICHVPLEGEPTEVYWFGFDSGHLGDILPRVQVICRDMPLPDHHASADVYRDIAYVSAEVERLAEQARAAAD